MNNTTATSTYSIAVDPSLISYAGEFFNSSFSTIITELLQNSRRAGATEVRVSYLDGDAIFIDNGHGWPLKQEIRLAHSGWENGLETVEHPAGFGLFCLATRGMTISSQGLQATVSSEAFRGEADVVVSPCDYYQDGTMLKFPVAAKEFSEFTKALEERSKFYPIPVLLSGKLLDTQDFLEGAYRTVDYKGLRIAVGNFTDRCNINFYGHVCPFAYVKALFGVSIRIDVIGDTPLQFVLPGRNAVVEDNFFTNELSAQIERLQYQWIAQIPSHNLSYDHFLRAIELGIYLPEAEPELSQYRKHLYIRLLPETMSSCLLLEFDPEIPIALQSIIIEQIKKGSIPGKSIALCPNSRMQGYRWYDSIPTVYVSDTIITKGNKKLKHSSWEVAELDWDDYICQVDRIEANYTLHIDGDIHEDSLSLPLYINADAVSGSDLDELIYFSAEDSTIEEHVDNLCEYAFIPDDFDPFDSEVGPEGFYRNFRISAYECFKGIFGGNLLTQIKFELEENLSYLDLYMPTGVQATITLRNSSSIVEVKKVDE